MHAARRVTRTQAFPPSVSVARACWIASLLLMGACGAAETSTRDETLERPIASSLRGSEYLPPDASVRVKLDVAQLRGNLTGIRVLTWLDVLVRQGIVPSDV